MSDYDICEKHKITYLVPEFMECPRCGITRIASRLQSSGNESDIYDADLLIEIDELIRELNERIKLQVGNK